jgi:hypothetical protein
MIKIVGVIKNTLTKDIRVKPVTNVGVSDEDVYLKFGGPIIASQIYPLCL